MAAFIQIREGLFSDRRVGALACPPTRQSMGVAQALTPVGVLVSPGTSGSNVVVPADAAAVALLLGAVVYNPAEELDASDQYAIGDVLPVLEEGEIYLTADTACTKGAAAFVVHTTGHVRNDVTGATQSARVIFDETLAAPGVVRCKIRA